MEQLRSGLGFGSFELLQTEIRADCLGPGGLERGLLLIGAKCCMLFCAVGVYPVCIWFRGKNGECKGSRPQSVL